MSSVNHLNHLRSRKESNPVFAFAGLMLALFVILSGLLWIAETIQPDADKAFSEIVIRPKALYVPSLPPIPTEREAAIALDLIRLHPQRTPEETVAVYRAILKALVENRGIAEEADEEAPGLPRRSSSGSYVD